MLGLNNNHKKDLRRRGWLNASRTSAVLFVSLCLLLICQPAQLKAEQEIIVSASDQEAINRIKMAYLYNFLKYIEIRQPNNIPLNDGHTNAIGDSQIEHQLSPKLQLDPEQTGEYWVCVLGQDPYQNLLDEMQNKKIRKLAVKVKRFDLLAEINDCHIVYVSQSKLPNIKAIMTALSGKKILTVGDISNFTKLGGMIRFTHEKSKVGLEINLSNVRLSDIQISALLLEIAHLVE
jgi:hypothetical protein